MSTAALPRADEKAPHTRAVKFLSVGATDVGRVRALNEDAYLTRSDIGLWAVADGMGGHSRGDAASRCVMDHLAEVSAFGSAFAFQEATLSALQRANADLFARAPAGNICGATVVALLAHDRHYACLWAGDSRAYLHRAGLMKRLTSDHSMVQDMVGAGLLSAEQARAHPQANVITRAVGAHQRLNVDSVAGDLKLGDRFLLCSDGLTALVADGELASLMLCNPLEAAVTKMVELALSRGGPDNITALLIAVDHVTPT